MANFLWSQTALKDLEKEETCPTRWKAQWLDKLFSSPSNEDMDRGKYFEQILLGESANKKELITDLPRLDNGTKSTDQLRIEAQAERGKRILFDPNDPEWLGFTVVSTQLPLILEDQSGVADIIASKGDDLWLIDVKLTKDLTNTRTIYGWGNDLATMDLLQLTHYKELYEKMYGATIKVGFLIFDYSTAKRIKFSTVNISDGKKEERIERFRAARGAVEAYSEKGWVTTPNLKECEKCPLSCKDRKEVSKIVKEIVTY